MKKDWVLTRTYSTNALEILEQDIHPDALAAVLKVLESRARSLGSRSQLTLQHEVARTYAALASLLGVIVAQRAENDVDVKKVKQRPSLTGA